MTAFGASPTPFESVPVPVTPASRSVPVVAGRTYELRTDAQALVRDEGVVVAIEYPLVFVADGAKSTMLPRSGAPFSRVSPLLVTPQSASLVFTADVACVVWVLMLAGAACSTERDVIPAGAGCGCGSCAKKKKAPCACGASHA